MESISQMIANSLSNIAINNGWRIGGFNKDPRVLYKNKMQISFDDEGLRIWTNIKDKGEGKFFKIAYEEMKDERWNYFVNLFMSNTIK